MRSVPPEGYTVFYLSKGQDLAEYLKEHSKKLSIVVLYSEKGELLDEFQTHLSHIPLGDPKDVTVAYLGIEHCPTSFIEANRVCALPTSLLFMNGRVKYKVVGLRLNELSIKSNFALRNAGLNPCAW